MQLFMMLYSKIPRDRNFPILRICEKKIGWQKYCKLPYEKSKFGIFPGLHVTFPGIIYPRILVTKFL